MMCLVARQSPGCGWVNAPRAICGHSSKVEPKDRVAFAILVQLRVSAPRCGITAPVTVHLPLVGRSSTAIPRPTHHPPIRGYSTSVSASVLQTEETGSIPVTRSRVATPKASRILSFVFCLRKVLSLPFFLSVGTSAPIAQLVEPPSVKRCDIDDTPKALAPA